PGRRWAGGPADRHRPGRPEDGQRLSPRGPGGAWLSVAHGRVRPMRSMSAAAARRTALAAQGFGRRATRTTPPTRRTILDVLARTQLLQFDSVSAVVRAH